MSIREGWSKTLDEVRWPFDQPTAAEKAVDMVLDAFRPLMESQRKYTGYPWQVDVDHETPE
jgi:hypothetical protein